MQLAEVREIYLSSYIELRSKKLVEISLCLEDCLLMYRFS